MNGISKHKWRLLGFDTFSSEWYPLPGTYATEALAVDAARQRLGALEKSQPSATSGGQNGIQDKVFIERPDGTRYQFVGAPLQEPAPKKQAKRSRGFTLIELLIVLAMVGIIAAIAIPSYLRAKDSLTRQRAQASGAVEPGHTAAQQPALPTPCPTKQTAPDTWMFACSAEPFSLAFFSWRAAHPHLTVRMVVPFAYRFMSDTEVLVITDNPMPRPPAEQEERR